MTSRGKKGNILVFEGKKIVWEEEKTLSLEVGLSQVPNVVCSGAGPP